MSESARLFQPLTFRDVTIRNRIVVAPMSTYSATDGVVDDFHLVHLGRFALGGAGLVLSEAVAVQEGGRITHGCTGLWKDAQIAPWRRITDFVHTQGAAAGIQLGHSGWKGGTQRPWHGGGPLGATDLAARGEVAWPVVSSSGEAFETGWSQPASLSVADLAALLDDFRQATRRAEAAGFDVVELHCAHGYLLHSFLSPLANQRDDDYGGSLENRMRFPLEVVAGVRAVWPKGKPLLVRISSVDGVDFGWSVADSVAFTTALQGLGVDAVDCSTGGMKLPREHQLVARAPGFQVPFSATIRRETGMPTIAVGLIRDAHHAEAILAAGEADMIALGRELLFNPNWANQAAVTLHGEAGWTHWPEPFGWWLSRRARLDAPRKTEV